MLDSLVVLSYPDAIKLCRHRKGWSQDQLARTIGVTINSIGRYERGVGIPIHDSIIDRAIRARCLETGIVIERERAA